MKIPQLKANEKLPRGSYFYIQVGHLFYAGEEAESIEIEDKESASLTKYEKMGGRFGIRGWAWTGPSWRGRTETRARLKRARKKDLTPTYLKSPKRPDPVMKKEFTGQLKSKLVEEKEQAKRYRRQDLVQNACERLKTVYGDLDVKISVKYEEGEPK